MLPDLIGMPWQTGHIFPAIWTIRLKRNTVKNPVNFEIFRVTNFGARSFPDAAPVFALTLTSVLRPPRASSSKRLNKNVFLVFDDRFTMQQ